MGGKRPPVCVLDVTAGRVVPGPHLGRGGTPAKIGERSMIARGVFVLLNGRVCSILAGSMRALLRDADAQGRDVDPEVRRTIEEIEQVSAEWRASGSGSPEVPDVTADAESVIVGAMTTRDVADRYGCSERNVRQLAARGSLPGRRSKGAWLFDPHDVAELLKRRTA